MSVIVCEHCDRYIDTDYDCEHEETCEEEMEFQAYRIKNGLISYGRCNRCQLQNLLKVSGLCQICHHIEENRNES